MNKLVSRIAKLPLQAANIVSGGNAIDAIKKHHNPLLRRAKNTLNADSKIMKRMVERYGTQQERHAFSKERVKTHVARAATITGGSALLLHERNKRNQRPQYAY